MLQTIKVTQENINDGSQFITTSCPIALAKEALLKLYGYTSNEEGIRHSLIDEGQANVGMDEAIFMLGACASFSSYLLRKYKA